MKLDSCRGLKRSLQEEVVPDLLQEAIAAKRFALAAGPMPSSRRPQRRLALGIAPKGKNDYRLAVRIQRRALMEQAVEQIVKKARQEVDIRYIGRVQKRSATAGSLAIPWYQARQRPLLIGASVGHFSITAGTIGGFVRPRNGGAVAMLSNNHVLADEGRGGIGDDILQQGRFDKGRRPQDVVAVLANFVSFKTNSANFIDCAIASIQDGTDFDRATLQGIGAFSGQTAAAADNIQVAKVGRTTGVTRGRVTAFELDDVIVSFDVGNLRFDDQLEIEGAGDSMFSDGGDSGSLIVNEDLSAVGLLFAGSDQGGANGKGLTYANPILSVLDALKVDFAS
jgi:hypothetical protein